MHFLQRLFWKVENSSRDVRVDSGHKVPVTIQVKGDDSLARAVMVEVGDEDFLGDSFIEPQSMYPRSIELTRPSVQISVPQCGHRVLQPPPRSASEYFHCGEGRGRRTLYPWPPFLSPPNDLMNEVLHPWAAVL